MRAERAILDTLLHLSQSLGRIEELLGIHSTSAPETSTPTPNQSNTKPKLAVVIDTSSSDERPKDIKVIARIANEYTQMMYLVTKARAEGCEYVTDDDGEVQTVSVFTGGWVSKWHSVV